MQTQQRNLEAFLGLALKAQSQSRATIAALVELKYPRQLAFVKQANISHGHQQINNGSRAQEFQSRKSKLNVLENDNGGKTMDKGAAATAGGNDPAHQTMDIIDRPDQPRRQVEGVTQRGQGGKWRELREMIKALNQALREQRKASCI